jgi:hypothetical protein
MNPCCISSTLYSYVTHLATHTVFAPSLCSNVRIHTHTHTPGRYTTADSLTLSLTLTVTLLQIPWHLRGPTTPIHRDRAFARGSPLYAHGQGRNVRTYIAAAVAPAPTTRHCPGPCLPSLEGVRDARFKVLQLPPHNGAWWGGGGDDGGNREDGGGGGDGEAIIENLRLWYRAGRLSPTRGEATTAGRGGVAGRWKRRAGLRGERGDTLFHGP